MALAEVDARVVKVVDVKTPGSGEERATATRSWRSLPPRTW